MDELKAVFGENNEVYQWLIKNRYSIKSTTEAPKLTFGKYKGSTIRQVAGKFRGRDYLSWLLGNSACLQPDVRKEIEMLNIIPKVCINKHTEKKTRLNLSIAQHIKKKIEGYRQQDLKAGRLTYNDKYEEWSEPTITPQQFSQKILDSNQTCVYCEKKINIFPEFAFDPMQLTLDRVNNDRCHTNDNCVVCCYGCNTTRSNDYTSEQFKRLSKRRSKYQSPIQHASESDIDYLAESLMI